MTRAEEPLGRARQRTISDRSTSGPGDARLTLWYFITSLGDGGAERTLIELANGVDRTRYDVTVWTIFEQNPLAHLLTDDVALRTLGVEGVEPESDSFYVVGPERTGDYLRAPVRFLRAVRAERPDVVQSFLFYDNVIARVAGATVPGTSVVSGVRCVPDTTSPVKGVLDRVTVGLADRVVSNSTAGAEFAVDRGAAPTAVEVIHNGRDVDLYGNADAGGLRSSLGIPEDVPVVGTVGRLVERKGHLDLLAAWPAIREAVPDAELLLVGDGPLRGELARLAERRGCADSVHLPGRRQDVPRLLDLMDVFVFPSHYEGLPGAVLEAMAAGLPIVATPVDGNAELITHCRNGLHVGVRTPEELAWATIRLLEHPELSTSLGTAARERARADFRTEQMVARFEALYRSLA